jgi:transposase
MEVLYPRCAGLDVHKDLVVACARIARGGQVFRETARFGTTTRELLRLQTWLLSHEVTHVGMESTGVYWKPVWHILAGVFELTLGNARAMRNVPGRKSDQGDAAWIADLMAHGLIQASFVPDEPIQELRDLTRTRKQLMHERGRYVQRLQKILEDANLKLASVLSDITGASGRKMLSAIINGATDAGAIAKLANPRVKAAPQEIVNAVEGCVTDHHRYMLRLFLHRIDSVDADVAELDARIEEKLGPFREQIQHLMSMPGVSDRAAAAILAEIGADLKAFKSEDHLVS